MDIKSLEYFVAVVESESITRAAKALHMSQPPLSHQMKLLEQELDTILFERGSRNISLTPTGKALYQRAKSIMEFIDDTNKEIKSLNLGAGGNIKLGLISSFDPIMLCDIMGKFNERYSDVKFDIYEQNTYYLLDSLENNLIEVAFVRTPFENPLNFDKIDLKCEPLVAFGNRSFFSEINEQGIELDFLKNKPLIIYRRWMALLDGCFKEQGINPRYMCVNDDAKTSMILAMSGNGIALVPQSISRIISEKNICSIPINCERLTTKIMAIWKVNRYISPAMANFLNILRDVKAD